MPMAQIGRTSNKEVPSDKFRLFRAQRSIEIPAQRRQDFYNEFPYHNLYAVGSFAVDLLKYRETKPAISESQLLRSMTLDAIIRSTMASGRRSARRYIRFPVLSLDHKETRGTGDRSLALLLDDPEGILEEERRAYLIKLRILTGVNMEDINFVPDLTLGRMFKETPTSSSDVVEFLTPFIPDAVTLKRVRRYPTSDDFHHKSSRR